MAMLACLWNSSRETQKQEHKAADSSASAANSIQTCPAGMRSGPAHVALLCERTIARSHGGGTARRRRGGRAANEPDGENGHIRGHADRGHVQRGDQLRGWQPAQGSQPSTVPRKCLSRTSIYRQRARALAQYFGQHMNFSQHIPVASPSTFLGQHMKPHFQNPLALSVDGHDEEHVGWARWGAKGPLAPLSPRTRAPSRGRRHARCPSPTARAQGARWNGSKSEWAAAGVALAHALVLPAQPGEAVQREGHQASAAVGEHHGSIR